MSVPSPQKSTLGGDNPFLRPLSLHGVHAATWRRCLHKSQHSEVITRSHCPSMASMQQRGGGVLLLIAFLTSIVPFSFLCPLSHTFPHLRPLSLHVASHQCGHLLALGSRFPCYCYEVLLLNSYVITNFLSVLRFSGSWRGLPGPLSFPFNKIRCSNGPL